jgi:hypothetical protein
VLDLLSMAAALTITVMHGVVFGLLSIGAMLAVVAPSMLNLRPVRLIPRWVQLF